MTEPRVDPAAPEKKPRKRLSEEEKIDLAADRAARKVLQLQRQGRKENHYRMMEDCLRAYKRTLLWEQHPEEYGFVPVEKSHDISIAPPPGSGVRDKIDVFEDLVKARKGSYVRSMARFFDVAAVVKLFERRPEFIVIRMYYFGEDADGNDRERPCTFEEIAAELAERGEPHAVKTLRTWRTKLVQEMAVQLFGIPAAVSIESREKPQKGAGADGQ